jgi:hypothetical protein
MYVGYMNAGVLDTVDLGLAPVGGIAELPDPAEAPAAAPDAPSSSYVPVAVYLGAALIVLGAGAAYTRRRRPR